MKMLFPTGPITSLLEQISGLSRFREENMKRFETLTDREIEVLRLIARGMKNPDIARELDIMRVTVQNHRASIREKLGITHASGYIKYALAYELIQF